MSYFLVAFLCLFGPFESYKAAESAEVTFSVCYQVVQRIS